MAHRIHTWTYSGRPSDSQRDAVRFLIGDTNSNEKLVDDCEIEYLLTVEGSVIDAAICACLALAAHFSRDFDGSFGSTRSAKPAEAYLELARRLRFKKAEKPFVAFAGGISVADKETREADTDRVRPFFRRDMNDRQSELNDRLNGDFC